MRRAYTLLEVLLVLAILVVVFAAATPALMGVLARQRLHAAAEQVRVEWTKAHVQAMKSGRIQVFRYELGGNKFTVQPWMATDDSIAPAQTNSFAPTEEERASPRLDESAAIELPEGVRFIIGDAQLESRSIQIEQEISDANQYETAWSRPILFYPDGTSSDAFLIVANDKEIGLQVELRGMTGSATIGEPISLEDLAR
ncbi:MAG: prepilin-type N-terminal cleavage/methylation domain-containing protein [Pirellulaceae bacterium]|nr:prepilin-type N-terminal cleavage/methylation domain-containing protein [Pirellulaceae bacterium]